MESEFPPYVQYNRKCAGPHQKTKYKMVAREGDAGLKFLCPPDETVLSCRSRHVPTNFLLKLNNSDVR